MPLSDIEIAHFERVVYGLKNFDIVLKDFTKPPLHQPIAMEHLDALKTWLDQCNIKFYEGVANLHWTSTMKHINEMGLEGFYDDGVEVPLDGVGRRGRRGPDDAESDFEPSGSEEEESRAATTAPTSPTRRRRRRARARARSLGRERGAGRDEMEQEAKRKDKERGRFEEDEGRPKSKRKGDYSASEGESDDDRKPKRKSTPSRRRSRRSEVSSDGEIARGAERPAGIGKRDVEGTGMDSMKNRGPRHTHKMRGCYTG